MVKRLTASPAARRFWPLLFVLLYWAARLHNLDALPIFLDEANHIYWSRLVWAMQPFHAASDGRLLNVWWGAVFWPFVGGAWIMRASTILITTLGFAALTAFVRSSFSNAAAVVAGVIYSLLPFAVFFERMALADSFSPTAVLLLLVYSVRLAQRPHRRRWSVLAGCALAAAITVKISNLIFVPAPALAVLVFLRRTQRRHQIASALRGYLATGGILLPLYVVLHTVFGSDLGLDLLTSKTQSLSELVTQFGVVGPIVWNYFWVLVTPPLLIAMLLCAALAIVANVRVGLFVTLVLLPTLGVLIARTSVGFVEARFALVYLPMLVTLGSGGAGWAATRLAQWGRAPALLAALLGVALLAPTAGFTWAAWQHPAALVLPDRDEWEYIRGWPSGYGFRELAADLESEREAVRVSSLDLGSWQKISAYLSLESSVTAEYHSADEILAGAWPPPHAGRALLVLDHPRDDAEAAVLGLDPASAARYLRPGGESWLGVYEFPSSQD